jgi:hypothetical protein
MSFLIKMALLVTVVVLFIPADPEELAVSGSAPRSIGVFDAYGLAAAAYSDISGFCDRNPAACVTGAAVGDVFRAKARTALKSVQSWLAPKPATPTDVANRHPAEPERREGGERTGSIAVPMVLPPPSKPAMPHRLAGIRQDT